MSFIVFIYEIAAASFLWGLGAASVAKLIASRKPQPVRARRAF